MMCDAGAYAVSFWLPVVAAGVVLAAASVAIEGRKRRLAHKERWLQLALKNAATQELKAKELLRTARRDRDEWKFAKMISDAMNGPSDAA